MVLADLSSRPLDEGPVLQLGGPGGRQLEGAGGQQRAAASPRGLVLHAGAGAGNGAGGRRVVVLSHHVRSSQGPLAPLLVLVRRGPDHRGQHAGHPAGGLGAFVGGAVAEPGRRAGRPPELAHAPGERAALGDAAAEQAGDALAGPGDGPADGLAGGRADAGLEEVAAQADAGAHPAADALAPVALAEGIDLGLAFRDLLSRETGGKESDIIAQYLSSRNAI